MNSEKTPKRTYGISMIVGVSLLGAFLLVLSLCSIVQVARNPGLSFIEIFNHHMLDLLLVSGISFILLWWLLTYALSRPLNMLALELYRIGQGDRSPVKIKSCVREIDSVVLGIDMMMWGIHREDKKKGDKGGDDPNSSGQEFREKDRPDNA